MTFEELVSVLRVRFPEFNDSDDVELLVLAQHRITTLSLADDLTDGEQKLVALLPLIADYLE